MRLIAVNIVRFVFLVLLQVFVISQLSLGVLNDYISMIVYISFVLTFPIKINKYITLIVAFLLGITVDMFLNTYGIHTSACVFMAFVRPSLLNRLQTESPIDETQELTVFTEDTQKYVLYTFILSFCFFFWLFLMEEFSFVALPIIGLKSVLSAVISTLLIILGQLLLFRKPKN